MVLRGEEIEHHNIVNDMMLKQDVSYRPQPGPDGFPKEPSVIYFCILYFLYILDQTVF